MSEQNPRTPAPPENAPKGKKKMDSTIPKTTRATSASTRPRSKRQAAKKALTEKETAVTPPLVTETPQQEQTTSKPPTSEVLEEDFFMSTEDPDNQSQSTAPSSDHSHPPTSGSEPPSPMSEPESEDPPSWMEALPNGLLEGEPSPTPQKLDKGKSRALETSVEPEDVFNLEDKETEVPYTLMDKGKGKSITAPLPTPATREGSEPMELISPFTLNETPTPRPKKRNMEVRTPQKEDETPRPQPKRTKAKDEATKSDSESSTERTSLTPANPENAVIPIWSSAARLLQPTTTPLSNNTFNVDALRADLLSSNPPTLSRSPFQEVTPRASSSGPHTPHGILSDQPQSAFRTEFSEWRTHFRTPTTQGLVFTPTPPGGFPRVHFDHPMTCIPGIVPEQLEYMMNEVKTGKVAFHVHGHGCRHRDESNWLRFFAKEIFTKGITPGYDTQIAAPVLETESQELNSGPYTLFAFNFPKEVEDRIVEQHVFSSNKLTIFCHRITDEYPTYVLSFTGIEEPKEVIRDIVIDTIVNSEDAMNIIYNMTTEIPEKAHYSPTRAVTEALKTLEIRTTPWLTPGKFQTQLSSIYLKPPAKSAAGWKALIDCLRSLRYIFLGNGVGVVQGVLFCKGCHSIDHFTGSCPFPHIPGWNGYNIALSNVYRPFLNGNRQRDDARRNNSGGREQWQRNVPQGYKVEWTTKVGSNFEDGQHTYMTAWDPSQYPQDAYPDMYNLNPRGRGAGAFRRGTAAGYGRGRGNHYRYGWSNADEQGHFTNSYYDTN